ncbi:hypothetical protein JCM8097_006203 [Rhodosporidiobolus ruineniae]
MSRRAQFGGRLTGPDASSAPSPSSAPPPGLAPHQQQQHRQQQQTPNKAKGKQRATGQGQQNSKQGGGPGSPAPHPSVQAMNAAAAALAKAADEAGETDDGSNICFICAEPVQYWSLGECSHRTCHTCSIRLRALYKKKECTFCKTECPTVIFTEDEEKPYEAYTAESTPFSDTKLGILFETRAQLDDTLSLLRFNCPFKPALSTPASAAPSGENAAESAPGEPQPCDQILAGWSDLKRHVRAAHGTTLCDLCCSNKKIFAHEHELFALAPPNQPGRGRRAESELDRHLETAHAMCGFCKRWFYDSDGLYKHCREQHEECFICTRQGIRHQYHLNYDRLEQHFKHDHYLCPHPECLAKKFVVFESEIDLQAHALAEHGIGSGPGGGGDQKARAQARRIETNFSYSTGETSRGGGGGGDRRRGGAPGGGAANRQPAASFVEPPREEPVPRGERRVPGLGPAAASGGRAARFGGQLTSDASPPSSGATTPRDGAGPDQATVERHAVLMRRVQETVRGNEGRVAGFKIAVRSYRAGEMSASDLVDQLFNIFDQNIDAADPIIVTLSELFEDPSKRQAVLSAWRDVRIEQNQFPSLAPLAPTLTASGQPTQANNTAGRALSAQHRGASSAHASSTWARVERAATASGPAPVAPRSNPFPALMTASNAKNIPGLSKAGKQAKRAPAAGVTAWSASSAAAASSSSSGFPSLSASSSAASSRPSSVSPAYTPVSSSRPSSSLSARAGAGAINRNPPRTTSGLEFPGLPSGSSSTSGAGGGFSMADSRARMKAAMQKPVGRTVLDQGGSWSPPPVGGNPLEAAVGGAGDAQGGGKKKGKGRQKVVLMSSGLASQTQ